MSRTAAKPSNGPKPIPGTAPTPPHPKAASVAAEIAALRAMTVSQLRDRWQVLYGEEARSRNKQFLFRRLAWRVQELAYGGLSERAKARLAELRAQVSLADLRIRPARGFNPEAIAASAPSSAPAPAKPKRDPRLPRPGAVLLRTYHGGTIRVTVLDDGFEHDGRRYGSLTALARAITGQHVSGWAFFGLTKRTRG